MAAFASEILFRSVPVSSPDATLLMEELNAFLLQLIGNNGTKHVQLEDFDGERSVFLVGYWENEPICCAGIRQMDTTRGEVKRVFARPNTIGAGMQLMAALEQWATTHGYQELLLECRTGNPQAIAFYRRNGYTVCENYPPYVGIADAICMLKALYRKKTIE